jgi:hypothetical protein
VLRPNAPWNACRPPQVSVRNSTTIPVVFTGVSGSSQALLVAATPRDLVGSNARLNPKLLELLRWFVPNTTLIDSLVNRASSEAAAREDRHFAREGGGSGTGNDLCKTHHRRSNESGGRRGQENSRVHQGPWWVSGRSSCVTELGTDARWVNEVG